MTKILSIESYRRFELSAHTVLSSMLPQNYSVDAIFKLGTWDSHVHVFRIPYIIVIIS